jgi:hypothetical protein
VVDDHTTPVVAMDPTRSVSIRIHQSRRVGVGVEVAVEEGWVLGRAVERVQAREGAERWAEIATIMLPWISARR